ncbi:hypothetical protein MBLNU230_g0270t1 [Neophaeotheca triangularis]
MSFSLSSLLNPEPSRDGAQEAAAMQRRESIPAPAISESPRQENPPLPQWQPPSNVQHRKSSAADDEAARALASLAGSSASPPTRHDGFGRPPSAGQYNGRRASEAVASNGHNAPMELPRPSSSSGGTAPALQTHSPTLEAYHMASRSPEAQRRASVISTTQSAYILPPIQGFTSSQQPHLDPTSLEEATSNVTQGSHTSQTQLTTTISNTSDSNAKAPSPATVKPEPTTTPLPSSPAEAGRTFDPQAAGESHNTKTIASLKNEHGLRTQSPLRDSSVPLPSTEMSAPNPKKRPAPSKKKGTANAVKKAPASKKRKIEPSSKAPTLKAGSSRGTPAGSSPAPSTRSYSDEDEEMEEMDEERDGDSDLYCICKKPDNGTFMIGCDGTCDDWFHGKCVGIEEKDKNLIDKYICPNCEKLEIGKTTFKPMCRKQGCRQPARVGKSKGAKNSKYCSEACGIAYFADLTAKTEASKEKIRNRGTRRKNGAHLPSEAEDNESGARGGILAPSELKTLLHASKTVDDFKKLGEGVLSPPATPDGKGEKDETIYNLEETAALQEIASLRERARNRHLLLKDRIKFVNMIKQAASAAAVEKELKPKDFCGYDSRLEWTEKTFSKWLNTPQGKTAMELETLATEGSANGTNEDTEMADGNKDNGVGEEVQEDLNDYEVCDKKKCARHAEWTKVCVDHVREELSSNGDRMRWVESEAARIKERAVLRNSSGAGGEGSVEIHDDSEDAAPQDGGEAMEVDERPASAKSVDLPMRKIGSAQPEEGADPKSKSGSEPPQIAAQVVVGEQSGLDVAT